ncbi:hypothetical protein KIF24_20205 [Micromonospora sp. Llam7]|uniref:hypothetical protein n=1 Tax=Micromonospora tarapacensis TaxID=2835305 RepID=UPI001C8345BB|nr:hypothetical protein [Micromonospora tarapacensis]MBX7268130.1 hypothetical protein [Micromonospora tarapacensis]
MEPVSKRRFVDEVVAATRERGATTHLYLMLREGGGVGVQWEQPGVDQLREYRLAEPDGSGCPHCAILDAVLALSPVLPLDTLRTARSRVQYETILRAGMLPSPAFARQAASRDVTWLADCHGAPGNPHTEADCAEHAALGPPVATDPLDVGPTAVLPRALLEIADATDVRERLRLARDWRETAAEVARRSRTAETTWGFLRNSGRLGVPAPGVPGMVYALEPGAAADDRRIAELSAAAVRSLSGQQSPTYDAERVCLVPDPVPGGVRMPSYAGAVEVAAGRPVRTLRLPSSRRPLSRLGRGVLLLFEARYAMLVRHVQRPRDWESEAALHMFEFGMLEELGGDGYVSAVAAHLAALRKEGDLLARPDKILGRRQRKALAGVFGKIDDEELHLWGSVAYRNAIMLGLGGQAAFAEHLRRQAS